MNTLNYLGNHIFCCWVFLILMAPIVIMALLLCFLLDSIEFTVELQIGLFLSIFLTFVWIVFAGYVGHRAARNWVVKGMGYQIEEMEYSRDKTRCCGMGGMIAYADLKLSNRIVKKRAAEAKHDELTYCASCREAFWLPGKAFFAHSRPDFQPRLGTRQD